MKDIGSLMKQAQAMQEKLQAAQAKLAESELEGTSGGGLVALTLTGAGSLSKLTIDNSLLKEGEGEIVADLIIAAHADARQQARKPAERPDARRGRAVRRPAGNAEVLTGFAR